MCVRTTSRRAAEHTSIRSLITSAIETKLRPNPRELWRIQNLWDAIELMAATRRLGARRVQVRVPFIQMSKESVRLSLSSLLSPSRLLKKILGEGSVPSPTSFLRAFSRNLYARIADFLAFGHTSPRTYAEGTTARFLIRTRL